MTNTTLTGVYAMGNFDGLHKGHQFILSTAQEHARKLGTSAGLLTFTPHPRAFFQPDAPPFLIYTPDVRDAVLAGLGIDVVHNIPFTRTLADMTPDEFVNEVLAQQATPQTIMVGQDFCFGKDRAGDAQDLKRLCKLHNIDVIIIECIGNQTEKWSSSQIRNTIRTGDMKTANQILTRPWTVSGTVIKGDQRGREIGFPTANIDLGSIIRPANGVYAVTAHVNNSTHHAIANFGTRPTVDGVNEKLEVHIFDFESDIYGKNIHIEFHEKIRDEQKFPSLNALKNQIQIDCKIARKTLGVHSKV